jgi:DNA-directed RNA polymerase specialized sigma24 family protein
MTDGGWVSAATSYPSIGGSLRVRNGELLAWDDVLRRYGTLVAATVRSFQMQDADALDAIQMTWLRLAENAHRVQFPERLGGRLATTARNECLRIRRKAGAAPELRATELGHGC